MTENDAGPKSGQINRQKMISVLRQMKLVDKKLWGVKTGHNGQ